MVIQSDKELVLSAVRALWGHVPPCLRTASIELREKTIFWRCIFDDQATDNDFELLRMAGTEIIADYSNDYEIEEELLIIPFPTKTENLRNLVYFRHEHDYYQN